MNVSISLPSFLRDWLLKKFSDDEGNFDVEEVADFVRTYLPRKEEWISIKNRIVYENERVQILTKVAVDIDIKTGEISFSLPDFGLTSKETIIESHVWEEYKNELVNGQETWGVIELGYRFPDDFAKPKIPGKIKMTGFTNFCTYSVDLDYYKDARADTRDTEAVKRIATAYLKLLFPNVRTAEDVNPKRFLRYCLRPARNMRQIIKRQMGILDTEFKGKDVPTYGIGELSSNGG